MTIKKLCILITIIMSVQSSWALDLKQARMKGFVTELDTGYIKEINPASKDLVIEVNKKRKKYYMKISSENGASLKEVAARAAQKLQKKHNQK
jgi:uncharacterized protein